MELIGFVHREDRPGKSLNVYNQVYVALFRFFVLPLATLMLFMISCSPGRERVKVIEHARMESPDEIPTDHRVDYSETDTIRFSLIKGYVNASQVIEDISFIPLETKPDCLIGSVGKVIYRNGKYYIFDYSTGRNSIHVFDSMGSFSGSISRIGRGPGEYRDILNFDVDEKGNVYIVNSIDGKILVFDPALKYSVTITPQVAISSFIAFRDRFAVLSRRNDYRNPEMSLLYILNRNGEIIESYFPFTQSTENRGPMTSLVEYEKKIYVNIPYVPVIFSIDSLFRISADYYLIYEYDTNEGKKVNRFATDPFKSFHRGSDYLYVSTGFRTYYSGLSDGRGSLFFSAFRGKISEGFLDPFPLFGIVEGGCGLTLLDADFLTGNFYYERAAELFGMNQAELTGYLWNTCSPQKVWIIYGGLALAAALLILAYDKLILRNR